MNEAPEEQSYKWDMTDGRVYTGPLTLDASKPCISRGRLRLQRQRTRTASDWWSAIRRPYDVVGLESRHGERILLSAFESEKTWGAYVAICTNNDLCIADEDETSR